MDADAKILVTRYLPGVLVEGSSAQAEPSTYRQAGELLARFHAQFAAEDSGWNDGFRARVRRHLGLAHRIDPAVVQRILDEVDQWPGGGALVVPTHGDWQPRN